MSVSNSVDRVIKEAIEKYDGSYSLGNPFEELVSLGELVDRLSIVNYKLYNLKDEVMRRPEDQDFKAWAAEEDVRLVMERARLKRCIDQKALSMIERYSSGDKTAGVNAEVKNYGDY